MKVFENTSVESAIEFCWSSDLSYSKSLGRQRKKQCLVKNKKLLLRVKAFVYFVRLDNFPSLLGLCLLEENALYILEGSA